RDSRWGFDTGGGASYPGIPLEGCQSPSRGGFWGACGWPGVCRTSPREARTRMSDAVSGARARHVHFPPDPASLRRHFGLLVGESPAMRRVYTEIARVAPTDAAVLIVGESGTGKDLVAQVIHQGSKRAAGPYLPINCRALSPSLIESQPFGHA